MGPELFREFILPGIVRQSEAIHAGGGYFVKHTDGNVWSILDDLAEAEIDGWHSIQPNIFAFSIQTSLATTRKFDLPILVGTICVNTS